MTRLVGMVEFGLNGVACVVLLPYTGCSVQRVLFPYRGGGGGTISRQRDLQLLGHFIQSSNMKIKTRLPR